MERSRDKIKSQWVSIASKIPTELLTGRENLLKDYYRAQLRIAQGRKVKARRILGSLDARPEFAVVEEKYPDLFAAIDIATRGSTNRRNGYNNPIKPLFTL